jgi:thioredoxin 1
LYVFSYIEKKSPLGGKMGQYTKPVTDASFESDVLKSNVPVLVDFWAEWCGPCQALGPKLEEAAQTLGGKVIIAKLNVDENPETASKYGVRGIPTMIMFKNGQDVDQVVGNVPKETLLTFMQKHV